MLNSSAEKQTKLDQPEFLLLMVITFMLWSIGFVDLLSGFLERESLRPSGVTSGGIIGLLAGHCLLFLIWLAALVVPRSHHWLAKQLAWVQRSGWTASLMLAVMAGVAVNLIAWAYWVIFPGFSTILFISILLFGGILLFAKCDPKLPKRRWRRIALTVLGIVLGAELLAQGLAFAGAMPGNIHSDGGYIKYGRVYQDVEGFTHGLANRNGWYSAEFPQSDDSHKIAFIGDSFVQALQIDPSDHMATQLQAQLNTAETPTEIYPLGHAGTGPSIYLFPEILLITQKRLDVDEIVVFVHLGNDLRNVSTASAPDFPYQLNEEGNAVINPDSFSAWHDVGHFPLLPYVPIHPMRILESNLMLPLLWRSMTLDDVSTARRTDPLDIPGVTGVVMRRNNRLSNHTHVRNMRLADTTGRSNFLFERDGNPLAEEAHTFTESFLSRAQKAAEEGGMQLRIVTIPVFPPAFYTTYGEQQWEPTLEQYDLLLPERRLQTFASAENIPFLAVGQHMLDSQLSAADVKELYYSEGTGHLTPAGHQFFAQAAYDCFYRNEDSSSQACSNQ